MRATAAFTLFYYSPRTNPGGVQAGTGCAELWGVVRRSLRRAALHHVTQPFGRLLRLRSVPWA